MRLIFGGKIIKVEVLDEKGNLITAAEKGFVVPQNMQSDEDCIVMIKGRDLPELDRNKIVTVVTTTKSSDRISYSGAVSVSMETQMNIRILRSGDMKVLEERRRFFKIKVHERGKALFYVRDEKTIRFEEPVAIGVRDINVGGVFLMCDPEEVEFVPDDLICVEIHLFEDYPLNAAVRVLRVQRGADGDILGYGCEFRGLTAAQEDYIGRFILRVQSEQRQKEAVSEERI
ncbi:MAG: PilZ domain-containing protein [Lachnospiraceae bacterium]|nr:PilZ domain-containing protein [Ruminococcus sp.]MCM1274243.1 PilZ domain-containing protein [Lachnospiraceae bacterium]